MAANAKVVKRRIKSIANTMKITKAMELVAASKMRRATSAVLNARPYAKAAWDMVKSVTASAPDVTHPLLQANETAPKHLIVLFTADRGLAGGLNTNVLKEATTKIKSLEKPVEAITIGKRGTAALTRQDIPIIAQFEGFTSKPKAEDIIPVGKLILNEYGKGAYEKVFIAYTDYISGLTQKARVIELLPLSKPDTELGETNQSSETEQTQISDHVFEPSAPDVLNYILPKIAETMVFQALLESAASEHAARMVAMKNATENAKDMLGDLKLTYNRIRQAGITQEIAEISSGAAAIE